MKQLLWLLAIVTLLVGRRHYHSDRWLLLGGRAPFLSSATNAQRI